MDHDLTAIVVDIAQIKMTRVVRVTDRVIRLTIRCWRII
jgi:hypothetical protein